jgi:hypothetical protein
MILSILFLALAALAYSISQLHLMGKLRWQTDKNLHTFFGRNSWVRKYKGHREANGPAFKWSTTYLVFLTDFYHALQMIMKISLSMAIGGLTWWSLLYWSVFTVVMSGSFKLLSK